MQRTVQVFSEGMIYRRPSYRGAGQSAGLSARLVIDLGRQGVMYAEIRMSPQAHVLRGLTQSQVVEAALEGLEQGMEVSRAKANLVLCTMRGSDEKTILLQLLRRHAI